MLERISESQVAVGNLNRVLLVDVEAGFLICLRINGNPPMSISAEVVVLFREPQTAGSPLTTGLGLSLMKDADLYCWVSPTGELEYQPNPRIAPLIGEATLDGRLWSRTLGRYWSRQNPTYGGDPESYAKAIAELAKLEGVQFLWYGAMLGDGGCRGVPAVTPDWISEFFGAAIRA